MYLHKMLTQISKIFFVVLHLQSLYICQCLFDFLNFYEYDRSRLMYHHCGVLFILCTFQWVLQAGLLSPFNIFSKMLAVNVLSLVLYKLTDVLSRLYKLTDVRTKNESILFSNKNKCLKLYVLCLLNKI